MPNRPRDAITKYEALFTKRTGLTLLVPRIAAFDSLGKATPSFCLHPDQPSTILIDTPGGGLVIKDMNPTHVMSAAEMGFIMFYEMNGEDMVRNTLCHFNGH